METAVDTNFVCVSFNDFRNGSAITVDIDSYAVVEAIGFANRVGVAYTKMGFSPASFTSWLSKEALLDSLAVDGEELSEIKIGEAYLGTDPEGRVWLSISVADGPDVFQAGGLDRADYQTVGLVAPLSVEA